MSGAGVLLAQPAVRDGICAVGISFSLPSIPYRIRSGQFRPTLSHAATVHRWPAISLPSGTPGYGPVRAFTLLTSHSHLDHVCNNDLIHWATAEEKQHFISTAGLPRLDAPHYFAGLFLSMEEYFDPLTGYQSNRLKFRLAGALRDLLGLLVDRRQVWRFLMSQVFAKFKPINDSRATMQTYETLPKQELEVGDVKYSGWILGEGDVWVLEERGHAPDEVLFYIPEHRFLHIAILTEILQEKDGLTVGEIYARLRCRPPEPVTEKYLDIEFPHSPPSLQNVIASSLLEMGHEARGPRRHKRFYRPKEPR